VVGRLKEVAFAMIVFPAPGGPIMIHIMTTAQRISMARLMFFDLEHLAKSNSLSPMNDKKSPVYRSPEVLMSKSPWENQQLAVMFSTQFVRLLTMEASFSNFRGVGINPFGKPRYEFQLHRQDSFTGRKFRSKRKLAMIIDCVRRGKSTCSEVGEFPLQWGKS